MLYSPFATAVFTPECSAPTWEKKQVRYAGYHELAYLIPIGTSRHRRCCTALASQKIPSFQSSDSFLGRRAMTAGSMA